MQRFGMIIRVREGKADDYSALHAAIWPEVLALIEAANLRNYSIFHHRDLGLLFSYFEYVGSDFEADMKTMAEHETTQRWWKECEVCVAPIEGEPVGAAGSWWQSLEEVFHAG